MLKSNFSLHCKSKVLPLNHGRKITICSFMFKSIRRYPDTLMNPIREGNRSNSTRLAIVPFPRSDRFKKSIAYIGPTFWNNLPLFLKMCNDYNSFKAKLNKYMYDQFCGDGFG